MNFDKYQTGGFYDEMFLEDGTARLGATPLKQKIEQLSDGELRRRQKAAESSLLRQGITFTVYSDNRGTEKIWPFDLIPRIVEAEEWERIDAGLRQRIQALNLFINDIYHDQKIVKDGIIPEEIIRSATAFREQCVGLNPPKGVWCHITGTDLVRDGDGTIYVLEDNMRCPSGVSYVLANRELLKRTFPRVFESSHIRPVVDYPSRLLEMLKSLAPEGVYSPNVVVLTPAFTTQLILNIPSWPSRWESNLSKGGTW